MIFNTIEILRVNKANDNSTVNYEEYEKYPK